MSMSGASFSARSALGDVGRDALEEVPGQTASRGHDLLQRLGALPRDQVVDVDLLDALGTGDHGDAHVPARRMERLAVSIAPASPAPLVLRVVADHDALRAGGDRDSSLGPGPCLPKADRDRRDAAHPACRALMQSVTPSVTSSSSAPRAASSL
jgi:hypothetical protein